MQCAGPWPRSENGTVPLCPLLGNRPGILIFRPIWFNIGVEISGKHGKGTAKKKALKIKVAGARQEDVGKGIVRLGSKQILALARGDMVEIKGKKTTAAIAVPAFAEGESLESIRIGFRRGE